MGNDARAIVDTSLLISAPAQPLPGKIAISAASLAELHFGVLVAEQPFRATRLQRLSYVERHFEALPIDHIVAVSYGRLAAAVVAKGRQPRRRTMDLLIAATAHAHGATLYTTDVSDFAGLEDLVDVVEVPTLR